MAKLKNKTDLIKFFQETNKTIYLIDMCTFSLYL